MEAPHIETDRMVLRPFSPADVEALADLVFSNPEVMKTLPQDPGTRAEGRQYAQQYVDTYSSAWSDQGYGGWAVCSRTGELATPGTLLGFCGFEPVHLDEELGAELSFGYGQPYWGKGVGYEAAAAAVEWYFVTGGFERFYAFFGPTNDGSKRILEKIGMKRHSNEDLWDSVAQGIGLLRVYTLDCNSYFLKSDRQ